MVFPYPLQGMGICETKEDETTNFDWFCGGLPYCWPNKAPLLPLHQRRKRPTKFLPNLTISFLPPQRKNNLAFLTKQPWHGPNLIHRYTNPLLGIRHQRPSAPSQYSVVHHKSSPETSQISVDFGSPSWPFTSNGKTWWDGFLVLFLFYPCTLDTP